MKTNLVTVFALSFSLVLFLNCNPESAPNEQVPTSSATWDSVQFWNLSTDVTTVAELVNFNGQNNNGLRIDYQFGNSGWFNLELTQQKPVNTDSSIVFYLKSTSSNYIELKFTDSDGSVFGAKKIMTDYIAYEKQFVVYFTDAKYWWGGNNSFDGFKSFSIAVSGSGSGTVWFDEIGNGTTQLESSMEPEYSTLDPDSTLAGIGFAQRRDEAMTAEDPLVLEYLKTIQDISSARMDLLPSMEDDQAQTFNNALVAIAFIAKNEKERAERILNFYADATDTNNTEQYLQNFYYNGEARGFFQHVSLATRYDEGESSDRWMGDMAWLLIACKNYELKYGQGKYTHLIEIIRDLLISFYVDSGEGGYVQHGWRNGDKKLHESGGHHEGNIDCYVALNLCGETAYADKIRIWLDNELKDLKNLPLDLYTWRVLAYGHAYASLLNIPEYDFRYRKILEIKGKKVMGFYHGPDITIDNFWNDGTGHMACAYVTLGEKQRGYFYANQLDYLIIERNIDGVVGHAIPYVVYKTTGYEWVNTQKGFVSSTAWYILAKNEYNPFLTQ
jgi:hypothetical protein